MALEVQRQATAIEQRQLIKLDADKHGALLGCEQDVEIRHNYSALRLSLSGSTDAICNEGELSA